MTGRDRRVIKNLYYIHRFLPASIARLYGLSHVRILQILKEEPNPTIIPDTECLFCGLEEAKTFYIDGNENNRTPQNIITLCEADRRMVTALQLRRKERIVNQPQS